VAKRGISRLLSRLGLVAVLGTCAGCGAPAWHNVDPARNTVGAFNHDQYECRERSRYRNAHRRWGEDRLSPYLVVDEDAAVKCLEARGWRPPP
jgi:hypothetical protein